MSVLQDKSRDMVIRELQRTVSQWRCQCEGVPKPHTLVPPLFLQNLDVNQALNNLLSREDDDADDAHEDGSGVVGLSIPSGGMYLWGGGGGRGGGLVWGGGEGVTHVNVV